MHSSALTKKKDKDFLDILEIFNIFFQHIYTP